MEPPQYAVVAYVRNSIGRFVEDLRREVDPPYAHLHAHITVLPPRILNCSENEARATLEALCADQHPFEITLGDVESFVPRSPVVFIRIAHAAYKMRELHDRLNTGPLFGEECWPYMPHLTIIKGEEPERAQRELPLVRERWAQFKGTRRIMIDELTFVRQSEGLHWADLALIQLGRSLAFKSR